MVDDGAGYKPAVDPWRDALRRVLRSKMPDGLKVLYMVLWDLNAGEIGPACMRTAEVARRIGADRKTVRERFDRLHRDWHLVEPLAERRRGYLNFILYRPLVGIKDSDSTDVADPQCRLALASEPCPGNGAPDSSGGGEWGIADLQSPIAETHKIPGNPGKTPPPGRNLGDHRPSIPHSLNDNDSKIFLTNASMKEPSLTVAIEGAPQRLSETELLRAALTRGPSPAEVYRSREQIKQEILRLLGPETHESFPGQLADAIVSGRLDHDAVLSLGRKAARKKAEGKISNAGGWLRRCIEIEWGEEWKGRRVRT